MKRILVLILMIVCVSKLSAQTPESVVRNYVRVLNDWLASPYDMQKREQVASILKPANKKCTVKDEIVALYNADAGSMETDVNGYLVIFSEKTKRQTVHIEVQSLKQSSQAGISIVTVILNYTGGVSLVTATDFWVFDNKIGYIVTNDIERYKLKNEIQENVIENGEHSYVDLGLPSGTLWATCNVGANNPWEYGDYFAWGETTPKTRYEYDNYKYSVGLKFTKYCSKSDYGLNGFTDNLSILQTSDDAARANWGLHWGIPTIAQCRELCNYCTWKWTKKNKVYGYEVKGRNGKKIFLPAAGTKHEIPWVGTNGNYWTTSLDSYTPNAETLFFNINAPNGPLINISALNRYTGGAIRAVYKR